MISASPELLGEVVCRLVRSPSVFINPFGKLTQDLHAAAVFPSAQLARFFCSAYGPAAEVTPIGQITHTNHCSSK